MNEKGHLTSEERAAYWQRAMTPQTLLEVSDHLQQCLFCREELVRERPATEAEEGVGYKDLVAWMDGKLDPLARRELSERIASSAQASAELADLQRFRQEMGETPAHDYSLGETPTTARSNGWLLPIAAGLALGLGFLWWNSGQRPVEHGLALNDAAQRLVVRQDGAVPALGPLPADLQNALREAAASGQLALAPKVAELRGTGEMLAGAPEAKRGLAVVAPVGTLVETSRPTLHWRPQEGATGYRVNLAPGSGAVTSSPILGPGQTEWTPNEPLSPNETYEWEVEALRDAEMLAKAPAPPEPEARFAILPEAKEVELQNLRQKFGRSHLLMGIAYAKAGLVPEARAQFDQLAQENPQSDLPKKLLASLTKQGNP